MMIVMVTKILIFIDIFTVMITTIPQMKGTARNRTMISKRLIGHWNSYMFACNNLLEEAYAHENPRTICSRSSGGCGDIIIR